MPTKESKKDLKDARAEIRKKHGDGAVMVLSEEEPTHVEVISTGLLSLDYAIRHPNPETGTPIGGIPRGRVTELFGTEGGGKSTLLQQVFANARPTSQRYSALIDSEHTFDREYACKIGVDVDNLVISQPQSGEEALDIAETLIKSNSLDLMAVDSAAMLTPKSEIEGEIGDSHVGGRARLLTQALSKLVPIIAGHNVAVIFTNQMRDKIGFSGYGDPTSTPGGRSLKHNASLRIEVRRIGMLKIGDKIVGARVRFRIAKNKLDAPFREAQADLIFGRGFCAAGDLIDFAVEYGVMQKSGATYQFGEEEFKRGRESLRERLLGDADLFGRIRQAVMEKINGDPVAPKEKI